MNIGIYFKVNSRELRMTITQAGELYRVSIELGHWRKAQKVTQKVWSPLHTYLTEDPSLWNNKDRIIKLISLDPAV